MRGVNGCFHGFEPNVALAFGGPDTRDDELLDAMEQLKDLARALVPGLGHAFIAIEPTFWAFNPQTDTTWWMHHGGAIRRQLK